MQPDPTPDLDELERRCAEAEAQAASLILSLRTSRIRALLRAARERDELRARADYAEKELGRAGAGRERAETEGDEAVSELQRVLAALDAHGRRNGAGVHADAARLIRELAADFDEYADHGHTCKAILTPGFFAPDMCDCGYGERVAKWRLE